MRARQESSGDRPGKAHPARPRGWGGWRRLVVLAAATAAGILGVGVCGADALIVPSHSGKVSYLPVPVAAPQIKAASGKLPVEYHGGPVMPTNTNYALYWDPAGAPAYPAGYQAGIDRYFEDLAHDSGGGAEHRLGPCAVRRRGRRSSPATTLTSAGRWPTPTRIRRTGARRRRSVSPTNRSAPRSRAT